MDQREFTTKETITGRKVLTTASVAKIVETFAKETQDSYRVNSLIHAHGHFIESVDLLRAFFHQFKLSTVAGEKTRIVNFLKKWIDLQRNKFTNIHQGVGKEFKDWVEVLDRTVERHEDVSKRTEEEKVVDFLKQLLFPVSIQNDSDGESGEEVPSIIKKKKRNGDSISPLLIYNSKEIARQLTLIDQSFLQKVDKEEMLKVRWLKPTMAPTLSSFSFRSNQLAHWVAREFLVTKSRQRIKFLVQLVKICSELLRLQNFQSMMSIYLGLNLPCLSMHELLWKQLPSKVLSQWKEITAILDYSNNFAAYRTYTKNLVPPMVPCQEVILKDLLYHDEGTEDFVGEHLIDMQKLDVMGGIIDKFHKAQLVPYRLAKFDYLYELLEGIPNMTSSKLDDLAGAATLKVSGESDSSLSNAGSFIGDSSENEIRSSRRLSTTADKLGTTIKRNNTQRRSSFSIDEKTEGT
eukprot:TRINITY_DN12797_c0_g1_i2.p1 TRINITY_DN12797_c0_g1~~TRINITY_DN12797_c0_g1_i2.p1  ORF type:complete len:463 (+),score=98.94 TRINITY_DN12797_c0_g1_i2:62-1450(+)